MGKPKFVLRDYQTKLSNDAIKMSEKVARDKGLFVQSQAGSGKTVIMADIAKKFTDKNKKVLFLVHRDSIIQQVKKTFRDYGVNMKLVCPKTIRTYYNDIFLRKNDFEPDLILTDEAHHAVSDTYLKVMQYYQKKSLTGKKVTQMYFTATPYRLDKKDFLPLANKDSLLSGPTTKWLIDNQFLAPFDYFEPKVMDLSSLKSNSRGDFTKQSVAEAGKSISGDDLVQVYQDYCTDEQALIYASSIESSKEYAKAFNQAGISAAHLDGISSKKKRRKIIQDYRDGKVKVLSNVELFTEGLDLPGASVAFLVRPTKSLSLYIQFSMRVLRYQKDKRAKIFDFAELHDRFGLPDTEYRWNLESRDPITTSENKKMSKNSRKCPRCKCIFQILPSEKNDWFVKCPNCGFKVWLNNNKTKSPIKELSEDELLQKNEVAIELDKVSPDEIGKFQTFSPELPFDYNYQIALRDIGYYGDSSRNIIIEMLDSLLTALYPTEKEIQNTLKHTDTSIDYKSLIKLIKDHNEMVENMDTILDDISPQKTLRDNYETIKKKANIKDDAEAIPYLFSVFREHLEFREYFAQEVYKQSIFNIERQLGYSKGKQKNQELSKIMLKQRQITAKHIGHQDPPIGCVFHARITDIKQIEDDDGNRKYKVRFADEFRMLQYAITLSSRDVFCLLSPKQQKETIKTQNQDAYKLLVKADVWARPMQDKHKKIKYDLERIK